MNKIKLYAEQFRDSNTLIKDGIVFNNIQIVRLFIDDKDIEADDNFVDALVVFSELLSSYRKSGKYLIFTCACGVADDGGWEYVDVTVTDKTITWEFEVGDKLYSYCFRHQQYIAEIVNLEQSLQANHDLEIEPSSLIYPQSW